MTLGAQGANLTIVDKLTNLPVKGATNITWSLKLIRKIPGGKALPDFAVRFSDLMTASQFCTNNGSNLTSSSNNRLLTEFNYNNSPGSSY